MHPRPRPKGIVPVLVAVILLSVLVAGCTGDGDTAGPGADAPDDLQVTSTAFGQGDRMPTKHTCEGANVKPPMSVTGIPGAARSLVLIMDDPDAPRGTVTHYTVWNIDPQNASWSEGSDLRARGAVEGATSGDGGDAVGYMGPCPPSGTGTHRYFFKFYALDTTLDLDTGAKRGALESAMMGRVLAKGELMGTYSADEGA